MVDSGCLWVDLVVYGCLWWFVGVDRGFGLWWLMGRGGEGVYGGCWGWWIKLVDFYSY